MELDDTAADDSSTLRWILITFLNIVSHFRISRSAASVILSLFSFVLGMVIWLLNSYYYYCLFVYAGLLSHPLGSIFPKNVREAIKKAQVNSPIDKIEYIVCPNEACNSLYKSDHGHYCTQIEYRKVCGSALGYTSHMAHGRSKWKPFKRFDFYPPSAWLKKWFASKDFNDLLCSNTPTNSDFITDICDGRIWNDFKSQNFFSSKYNVGLMLNTDWFKPFKRSQYKVAALILTVLNLPRQERFKKKWTIIAGMTYPTCPKVFSSKRYL